MAASALDIELSNYWPMLLSIQKESLLSVIKSFLQSPERISEHQYNQEPLEAEEEYKTGNYISSEDMLQLIRKW
jgi:hypothetical protein